MKKQRAPKPSTPVLPLIPGIAVGTGPRDLNHLVALFNTGRYAEAEVRARDLTRRQPLNGLAWKALGVALKQLGRTADAVTPMQRATALLPNDAEALNNLAATLQELGQLQEAEANCRRALRMRPNFAEAHNNLGVILHDGGKLDEAEASFRRALAIRPNFAAAHFNLHALLLNPADLSPAIKCLECALAADPANQERHFFLGMLLDYAGKPELAKQNFDIIEQGAGLYRAKLDAWRYLKSAAKPLPAITGSSIEAFKLALDIAFDAGLILEFGVRHGSSIRQIASLASQEVHGFDSFEGLPEQWHDEPKGSYSTRGELPSVPQNVRLHAGWFDQTLPRFLRTHPGPVRLMNIDCDIYSSTKTVLDLVSGRIVAGTVIVFDEYIGNEYWRDDEFKAFQEAVIQHGWKYRYASFSFFTKQVVVQILSAGKTVET